MRTVWVFAIILLATGIAIEVSSWELTPVWYHMVFLALLVPATVWGGMLRVERAGAVLAPRDDAQTAPIAVGAWE